MHSSCTLGKTLYVLAGINDNQRMNSIEKLANIVGGIADFRWQIIQTIESFQPRYGSIFCAWNEQEIVVLGGRNFLNEYLRERWVFDVRSETIKQVI